MNRSAQSTSQLTEFAPLSPEPNQPGIGSLLSKFFGFNKGNSAHEYTAPSAVVTPDLPAQTDWQSADTLEQPDPVPHDLVSQFPVDIGEGRSLPNILKRISNLLALKSTGLQAYKDTDFKQYWMPDSVSKECYDCGEKFTTFRRRHHCRVCGQIFCSRCCNQEIPGKIMGCTGDLRVCTYCCKVVLSYLQSADIGADLSSDLRALQEDLQTKFGRIASVSSISQSNTSINTENQENSNTGKRKLSLGFQEDKFALGRAQGINYMSMEERCQALQKSASLRALFMDICRPNTGLPLQTHRYRLRNFHKCFLGSELVDWLLSQSHAATRIQAVAIGQALLEAGYLVTIAEQSFLDGYALYRTNPSLSPQQYNTNEEEEEEEGRISQEAQEPLWVKQISQQDSTITDSESDCQLSEHEDNLSLPLSNSSFYLDLNVAENTVHICRPVIKTQENHENENKPAAEVKPSAGKAKPQESVQVYGISSEFLSGTLQNVQSRELVPALGWHSVKQLRTDNGEQQAFTQISNAFKQHEQNLLKQLLNAEGLSQSWVDVVISLAEQIVDSVRPDVRSDADDMDIRQYVQFKKVPGGSKHESCIVNGVVCTKNVAHRSMAMQLTSPRILLLGCSIVYQRIEGRLLSLEPVMMQEREYLRHIVTRIANLQPDLVLVHRNVSRLAQEFLLALKVTFVLNVKASVLERVSRCTQADIVSNVDAHIGRPQLGTCKKFYLKTFQNDKGATKTLMFFEGCTSQHLGCSVLLRGGGGGGNSELAKLKRVVSQIVFAEYSWRLEKSFLMDEFAQPPNPPTHTFFEEEEPCSKHSQENSCYDDKVWSLTKNLTKESVRNIKTIPVKDSHCVKNGDKNNSGVKSEDVISIQMNKEEQGTSLHNTTDECVCMSAACDHVARTCSCSRESESISCDRCSAKRTNVARLGSKEKSLSEEKRINVESVSDFSDPLHLYLNLEDEVFSSQVSSSGQWLSVAELPLSNRFRKALDDTILSSSPYLKFTVPYLETEPGRNCALRRFFTEEIYWSPQFETAVAVKATSISEASEAFSLQEEDARFKDIKPRPHHPFVAAKITDPIESNDMQTLLAHFRACGGRFMPSDNYHELPRVSKGPAPSNVTMAVVHAPAKLNTYPDALDPANHQRLAVLFCSYSHESNNAPAFCVNPWIVNMDFYGHNDIPLGSFLERYCFRTSYVCPSKTCDTPMIQHVRRFVHDMGCVHIILKELDKQIPDTEGSRIVMWNWCSICKTVSPVVPMSADTWSLSFAKYLELRFHGGMYRRRGQEGTCCPHSLHHDHYQYFGVRNIVASFKYTNVTLWEVSLPPPLIAIYYDPQQQANVIEEIKLLALKGYDVYSCILEKLCTFDAEIEGIAALKQQLQKEQAHFKSCIEEIQLKLTSPTLEAKKVEGQQKEVQQLMWRIEDSVVQLKRLIAEVVINWNTKIQDLIIVSKKRDEKHKKSDGGKPIPTASHSLEYDRVSSSSFYYPDDMGTVPGDTCTAQWDNASTCSEGREDMSPSSPEPPNTVGHAVLLDPADIDEIDSMSSGTSSHVPEALPPADPSCSHVDTPQTLTGVQGQSVSSSSPRGHVRSFSDVTPSLADDGHDKRELQHDKKSMKTILSHLLPTSTAMAPIQSPLSPQEHHLAPGGCSVPVVVYENEPSSIIAYAISSNEYQRSLEELLAKKNVSNEQANPSAAGVWDGVSTSPVSDVIGSPAPDSDEVSSYNSKSDKGNRTQANPHIEIQFSDTTSNFFCRVYFGELFGNLRQMVLPTGEEGFVRSLTRCVQWAARGGKSGSTFCKTKDDRFILKEMSRLEMQLFLDFAPNYFNYIHKCHTSNQPTLLGKIVGVYRIVYRNLTSNATLRSNLLVMENLFYGRSVTHKFDLKGSIRNRLVNPNAAEHDGEIVLMDENLLNMTCDDPLYILPHSKTVLTQAINNDTQFLASQTVMDYSLLVGLDKEQKELVVGIIDYIRTFTWDKKLETMVKSSGILGGQGKLPTVVSPELYRARFIAAMHRYFLPVPDRWTGLGKGLDC